MKRESSHGKFVVMSPDRIRFKCAAPENPQFFRDKDRTGESQIQRPAGAIGIYRLRPPVLAVGAVGAAGVAGAAGAAGVAGAGAEGAADGAAADAAIAGEFIVV